MCPGDCLLKSKIIVKVAVPDCVFVKCVLFVFWSDESAAMLLLIAWLVVLCCLVDWMNVYVMYIVPSVGFVKSLNFAGHILRVTSKKFTVYTYAVILRLNCSWSLCKVKLFLKFVCETFWFIFYESQTSISIKAYTVYYISINSMPFYPFLTNDMCQKITMSVFPRREHVVFRRL